jgi:hypothetical protein
MECGGPHGVFSEGENCLVFKISCDCKICCIECGCLHFDSNSQTSWVPLQTELSGLWNSGFFIKRGYMVMVEMVLSAQTANFQVLAPLLRILYCVFSAWHSAGFSGCLYFCHASNENVFATSFGGSFCPTFPFTNEQTTSCPALIPSDMLPPSTDILTKHHPS